MPFSKNNNTHARQSLYFLLPVKTIDRQQKRLVWQKIAYICMVRYKNKHSEFCCFLKNNIRFSVKNCQ